MVWLILEVTPPREAAAQRIEMTQVDEQPELEEDVPPEVEETKPIEEMEKVVEDPVIKDAKISEIGRAHV